jgi:hypothetical protein
MPGLLQRSELETFAAPFDRSAARRTKAPAATNRYTLFLIQR